MYKQLKITKKITITIEKFSSGCKKVSPVYRNGIRPFKMQHYKVFSIVAGTYRIMFTLEGKQLPECSG